MSAPWRDLVLHLRLPFQLALSVVFLWGVFASSGRIDPKTVAAWLAFTIGLSGGATAFNSYYDRDTGPIGGLRRPPPATAALLPFSLAVEAAGLAVVAALELRLGAVYIAGALLLDAYSHPVLRLKARPWLSMAAVATASGALMALAGAWAAGGGIPEGAEGRVVAGALSGFLVIAGYYPLTQLGQEEEDRGRGDLTFVLAYGRQAAFRWTLPVVGLACTISVVLAVRLVGWGPGSGLALAVGALGLQALRWRGDPLLDVSAMGDALAYGLAIVHLAVVFYRAITA